MNSPSIQRDPSAIRGTRLRVEDHPDWIVSRKVKNAPKNDNYPVTLLLLDRQIHADKLQRYTRYVRRLETPQAVQEAGKIEFDFDPSTQNLLIHGISIFRDGELTNHAKLENIEIIQRERELESGIYDGNLTALILLKDIRTGDIIDIESSIQSDNAIFPDHYWFLENLDHTFPVTKQYFSWLSSNHDRFQLRNTSSQATLTEEETPFGKRKTWECTDFPILEIEEALPLGLNPFNHITISSFQSWGEVASEFHQLWKRTETPGSELPLELEKIKAKHPENKTQLIEEIVAFVRDNVRYQGVETGRLGLVPETLDTIWERRFGDCKEKTSLLCWLLRQCDIEATPALVSFDMAGRITDQLPAPIFDHVVVHFTHEGQDYWLDPTNISQRGNLSTWNTLPFEKALLISETTQDFKIIAPPEKGQNTVTASENYSWSESDATIDVHHIYRGSEADRIRHVLDSRGRVVVQEIFTEIVRQTRSNAEIRTDLEISDDHEANQITLSAQFFAEKALSEPDQNNIQNCELVPHTLIGKVVFVDKKDRKHPIGLPFPIELEHTIRLNHPDAKGTTLPKTIINNEYLDFEAGTRNEDSTPELYFKYSTKASEIPAGDAHRYHFCLDQIRQVVPLYFSTAPNRGGKSKKLRAPEEWDRPSNPYQPNVPSRSGSGFPIWAIIIAIIVIVRIIAAFINN